MSNIPIKFSVYQLIVIGETPFNMSTFGPIRNNYETTEVTHRDSEVRETLSIKSVKKGEIEGRFVSIYFNEGNKYPYSPKIVDPSLHERDNPRAAEEIELDDQLFVLIDTQTQRLFLSEHKKRNELKDWLKKTLNKEILTKAILEEEGFVDKIKSIDKICFSVAPNLFNSAGGDILSRHLVEDIYGFGAKRAQIEFSYDYAQLSDNVRNKINAILRKKNDYEKIVVIGRGDDQLENTLNLDGVISKVVVEAQRDSESMLLDPQSIFSALVERVR